MTRSDDFMARVEGSPSGCWIWRAGRTANGYGQFRAWGECLAHRAAYVKFRGAIPEGLVIDHICGVRECVNPDHLEAVTQAENVRRGRAGGRNRAKTHCKRGHPYDEANTALNASGSRRCRACTRINSRRSAEKYRMERAMREVCEGILQHGGVREYVAAENGDRP